LPFLAGNVKEREFGTEASSNNESAEGAAYWSSLSGHDATNLSPQFADRKFMAVVCLMTSFTQQTNASEISS
jgi:hypothetical protein